MGAKVVIGSYSVYIQQGFLMGAEMSMHDHISIVADKYKKNRLAEYYAHTLFTEGIHNVIFCKPGLNKSPPGSLTYQKPVPF
jgi:hypothetical protein